MIVKGATYKLVENKLKRIISHAILCPGMICFAYIPINYDDVGSDDESDDSDDDLEEDME